MIIVLTLVAAALIYLLLLRCRSHHPGWEKLRGFHYAHRGLHGDGCPENSMAAFRKAVESGYGIELDVHLLADGKLAVIHDSTLTRTAGQEGIVEDMTLEQLQQYRLEGTEEAIPELRQVLEAVSGKVPLVVELKSYRGNHAALTEAVCRELANYPGAYCMESFDPRCVTYLRKHHSHVIRGQLAENFLAGKGSLPWIFKWILTCQLWNSLSLPDFVSYRFRDRKRLGVFLARKFWGAQGVCWTVTSQEDCDRAVAEGYIIIFEGFYP